MWVAGPSSKDTAWFTVWCKNVVSEDGSVAVCDAGLCVVVGAEMQRGGCVLLTITINRPKEDLFIDTLEVVKSIFL